MVVFEILAVVFGIIQGILVMLDKRSNWIFYSFQMLFLVVFSFNSRLWGDVAIDSAYFFVGIAGFLFWQKDNSLGSVSALSLEWSVTWCAISVFAIVLLYGILKGTDNPLPLLDSISSVTSIVATWLMLRHKLEAWIVWFFNDISYVVEYFMLPQKAVYLMVLYIGWTLLAIFTYINWHKILAENRLNETIKI